MSSRERLFLRHASALVPDTDIPPWSGYMPAKQLGPGVAFVDLPPVVRALLIADGTVTMALEALFEEPVAVEVAQQRSLCAPDAVAALESAIDEPLFYREVSLRGERSGRRFARAYSLLREAALEPELLARLRGEEVGMGVVLRHTAKSSYRRVLHMGSGDLASDAPDRVHRTYCVFVRERPCILITEVFSLPALAGV